MNATPSTRIRSVGRPRRICASIAASAAGAAALVILSGCLGDGDLGTGEAACVTFVEDDFRALNNVLERRCGTLDCHGEPGRPFVVFGQTGLRRTPAPTDLDAPDEYVTGGLEATTLYELEGTYQSACLLEPEKMDAVVTDQAEPETLTLLRKPRLEEKHKGGRVWNARTQKGDRCLLSWIEGAIDKDACILELEAP